MKEGFEPSIPVIRYGSLAGNWFQPLTHFTERFKTLIKIFLLKMLFKPNISLNTVSMLMIRLMPWASIITKPKRIASLVYRFNAAFVIIINLNGFIIL